MLPTFPTHYLTLPTHPEKRARGRCISHGCRRPAAAKKGGRCETCASRLFRLSHDSHYAYHNLKTSARKRGIEFLLSFEDFEEFCAVTGYLERRGWNPEDWTIDRIKTDLPYQTGNLRILTNADNASHKYEEYADAARARSWATRSA